MIKMNKNIKYSLEYRDNNYYYYEIIESKDLKDVIKELKRELDCSINAVKAFKNRVYTINKLTYNGDINDYDYNTIEINMEDYLLYMSSEERKEVLNNVKF